MKLQGEKRDWQRWGHRAGALLWMGVILFFSSRPGGAPALAWLPPGMDKLAHAAEYAVLGFLLSGGFAQRRAWIPALLAGAVFGAGDELFQAVIPGRDSSLLDWAADVAGLLVGAATRRHVHR